MEKNGNIQANITLAPGTDTPLHRRWLAGGAWQRSTAGQGRTGTVLAGYIMRTRGVAVEEVNIITFHAIKLHSTLGRRWRW